MYWITTHPESKERAEDIIKYIKNKSTNKKIILSQYSWSKLKDALKSYDEEIKE